MQSKPSSDISKDQQETAALLLWSETCPDRRVSLIQVITPDSPGARSGLPRFYLPVASGQFQGLYLDIIPTLKLLSKEQMGWIKTLTEQGCKVDIGSSSEMAIDAILTYLKIERRR